MKCIFSAASAILACFLMQPLHAAPPSTPTIEQMAGFPAFSSFTLAPDGRHIAALQADGRIYASTTVWDGKAAMRFAFDNWMTTAADVEVIFDVLRDVRASAA